MTVYFFDHTQTLLKVVPFDTAIEVDQELELSKDSLLKDILTVVIPIDEELSEAAYMAVREYEGNKQAFDMYEIRKVHTDETMIITGIQLGVSELKGYVVEDIRPENRSLDYIIEQLLTDSDWHVGYADENLPVISTSFYYVSVKDALKKLQSYGCELRFKVEISGNKIIDKWVEVYREMGNRTMKRFTYGSNALTVEREYSIADTYTALIGRGKGEESGDGYGRKITFEDVEWQISNGDPVDKPLGQKYVELPEATQRYGITTLNGKRPRVGIVEFNDTVDAAVLLPQTFEALLNIARPQVQFSASVLDLGKTFIGDTVTIHRYELGIHYETRIYKVKRNRKNDKQTVVNLGDHISPSSTKRQSNINSKIANIESLQTTLESGVNYSLTNPNGTTTFYQNDEPVQMKTGDQWYRDHPIKDGEQQLLGFTGSGWEIISDTSLGKDASELLYGVIDAGGNLSVINLTANSIVSGTLDLAKGISIGSGERPVLRVDSATGEVVMNVDSLLINDYNPNADGVHESDLRNYLRYDNGIVEIGEEEAEVLTQFSNDQWAMLKNNERMMWLEEDKINIRKGHFFDQLRVGNFGFVPRANGSLDFKKVSD